MPNVVHAADLPRLTSTRDGRVRIDLITAELFGCTDVRADFIRYRPGDTAAAHYHLGAKHFWFVSEGRGVFHIGDTTHEVGTGDVLMADDGEVHWFENPTDEHFAFYELWVPAPRETVWIRDDDV